MKFLRFALVLLLPLCFCDDKEEKADPIYIVKSSNPIGDCIVYNCNPVTDEEVPFDFYCTDTFEDKDGYHLIEMHFKHQGDDKPEEKQSSITYDVVDKDGKPHGLTATWHYEDNIVQITYTEDKKVKKVCGIDKPEPDDNQKEALEKYCKDLKDVKHADCK